jgi:two-component system chemotaxis response regulator CheY
MGKGLRVLVVDDSATVRKLVGFHLGKIPGMELEEAEDGLEAMEKLSLGSYDLVILDIIMPRMDGLKLLNYIRSNDDMKGLPVLILTTKGEDAEREKGMALGADAYIAKPIKSREFTDIIIELLDKKTGGRR